MMELFSYLVFVIIDYLKQWRLDVINVKIVLVVVVFLIVVVVIKKIVDFCFWYRYYIKLMKCVFGLEDIYWLYGNLYLV